MIQKIKKHLTILAAAAVMLVPALVPAGVAFADIQSGSVDIAGGLCSGSDINLSTTSNSGCTDKTAATNNLGDFLKWVVNIFSIIVGVVAVIMIIVGGFKYITSGGDSSKVGSAKNTLLYAIIGLIIVALAQVIVHFTLAQSTRFSNGS